MKYILTLMTLMVCSYLAIASDTTIIFRELSHSDLFDLAKKEKKGVMLYFHFKGCGACKIMERTAFKDKDVATFYNTNFINFEIDTQEGVGREVNRLYNIQLHPTFILFDSDGNELHRLVGVFSPEEFLKQAQDAALYQKNLTNYKKQYHEGNREPDFLYDYVYMLRNAYELDSTIVNDYLNAISPDEYTIDKNIKFIYEFCVHNYKIFLSFDNPRFDFLRNQKHLFYAHFDSNQVKTRIVWITNSAVNQAIEEKDEGSFLKSIEVLKEFDTGERYLFKEMDGRVTGIITSKNIVLTSFLRYYEITGDALNYKKTLDNYLAKIWHDADALNRHAWGVYENATTEDAEKIRSAIKCSMRSIELKDNYANNDTYAWLLFKSGDTAKALSQANKAIQLAIKDNRDYTETQKLIDTINTKNGQ